VEGLVISVSCVMFRDIEFDVIRVIEIKMMIRVIVHHYVQSLTHPSSFLRNADSAVRHLLANGHSNVTQCWGEGDPYCVVRFHAECQSGQSTKLLHEEASVFMQ
jgi:hypothetical protein